MKGFGLALLILGASDYVDAFVPSNFGNVAARHNHQRNSVTVDMSTDTDVSVPYDAAARFAYENWCKEYGKEIDESRYPTFKANYEAIAVMNVSTKKKARDSGSDSPSLLALNEFADYSAEEYEAAMNKDKEEAPSTTGNILGKAVEAAESQSAASSALQEAADALAEEEEVCF